MKLYVAGPMRGLPEFNFPTFDAVAAFLRGLGHEVANPAEHDREVLGRETLETAPGYATGDIAGWSQATGFSFAKAMEWDLRQVLDGDGVVLLPGWEGSQGARYERAVAEAAGKAVWLAHHEGGSWYIAQDPDQRRLTVVPEARVPEAGETRVVDPTTGGAKGSKLARFDLIPTDALWEVAEHFGRGAEKYEERNWERGYGWHLSYAALLRHLTAWWGGEDTDPETGSLHTVAVAWHALALVAFQLRGAGTDTRPGTVA